MKMPPRESTRNTSATIEATQRMLKSLPRGPSVRQGIRRCSASPAAPAAHVRGVDRELSVSCGMRMSLWVSTKVNDSRSSVKACGPVADGSTRMVVGP